MRKNSFHFLIPLGVALFVAIALIPILGGAGPELPNEAFKKTIPANDPFPHQAELAGRVNFWRHVFGVWGRHQVAIHDMTNPGIVYDVITLPEGNSGVDRKGLINDRVEDITQRLYILEQKVARGDDLDNSEQELLDKFRNWGKVAQLAGAHTRVRIQRGIREKFLRGLELSGRYDPLFRKIFRAHGVPEDLAFLPHVESSFQAQARSGAGAVGIWQFTLPAARLFMKVNAAVDERYDPVLAAEGCARYLASAYDKLGDWGLAITSYNHGIGGMSRASSEFGTDFPRILDEYDGPLFGFDSRNFYVEFLAAREVSRNAERYFGKIHRDRPQNWEKVKLDRSTQIHEVARNYGVTISDLTDINTALTNNAIRGRVSLPEGTSIWLPEGTQQRLASRTPEEMAPDLEPIQVVRAPEISPPAEDRMIAMVEPPESQSTLDLPIIERAPMRTPKINKWARRKLESDDQLDAGHQEKTVINDTPPIKVTWKKRQAEPEGKEIKPEIPLLLPVPEKVTKSKEALIAKPEPKAKSVKVQEAVIVKPESKEKNLKLIITQNNLSNSKINKDAPAKNKDSANKNISNKAESSKNLAKVSLKSEKTEVKVSSAPIKTFTPEIKNSKTGKNKVTAKAAVPPTLGTASVAPKTPPAKIIAKGKTAAESIKNAKTVTKPTIAKPEPAKATKDGKGKLANVTKVNQRRG